MGTPMAFTSGTTNGFSLGATKRATVALNPATSLVSGNNWFNGVDVSATQYLIYSDIFSQGQSTIHNSKPTAWTTPDLTDASLLALINTLPDRVGQIPYSDINVALQWLQNSEKYFLIKKGYEDIVTDGLVLNLDAGWYNSYPGSGTVWTDLSGQGNNGTLFNSPSFSSNGQGSLNFDGTDDYVRVNESASVDITTNTITFGAWCYPTVSNKYQHILVKGVGESRQYGMWLSVNGTSQIFRNVNGVVGQTDVTISKPWVVNAWNYIMLVYNGSTIKIYLNGLEVFSENASGNITHTNSNVNLGGEPTQSFLFVGNITNGQIYNRALTADEIFQNYNTQKTRFGFGGQSLFSGVTQYFDFSKQSSYPGTGTNLNDVSGNGFNDTITNPEQVKYIDGVKCLDCSTGAQINGDTSNSPTLGNNYTIFTWARVISSTAEYRTLLRTFDDDHPLLVESGGNTIGYYDNNAAVFVASSLSVSTLGLADRWVLYTIVGSSGTQQTFYINEGTSNSTVSANATGEKMDDICNHFGQIFGPVGSCVVYNNQTFTQSQVNQYYQSTKQYYGYAYNDIPNYGLVMNLDAGNPISYPRSGTVWYNSSGLGINGELQNGASYSTSGGGSIVLDGVDDRISVAHNDNLNFGTGDFTVLVWVSGVTSYPGGNTAIIMKGSRFDANLAGWGIMWAGSPADLYFIISSDSARLEGRTVPNGGLNGWTGWKLIGMQRRSGTWYQIVDTTFTSLGTFTGNVNNTQTLYMGYNSVYGGYLSSSYGNALIYNRALNQSELTQLYNAQKSRFGL
jgi:hypothetical protein